MKKIIKKAQPKAEPKVEPKVEAVEETMGEALELHEGICSICGNEVFTWDNQQVFSKGVCEHYPVA